MKTKTTLMTGLALVPMTWALATAAVADPVTGTVSDSSATRGLQGAEVTIVELGQTAIVGADGTFRFGDVPAGVYTVRARFAGAAEQVQSLTVADGGTATLDFVLSPLAVAGSDRKSVV